MIKCVVFDFDGTLVDSNAIKLQSFFEIVRTWDPGGEVAAEVIARWPAANRYEKTRRMAEELISRQLLPGDASVEYWAARLADDYTARCESAIASCREMPGASRTLCDLVALGLLLFVNSATPVGPLQRLLKMRNWNHYFQNAYGAEASKADNLRSIALETGAVPKEIVHVGDQPEDQRGAEQFGCHFVAMTAGTPWSVGNASPLSVKDLRELPPLFSGIFHEAS